MRSIRGITDGNYCNALLASNTRRHSYLPLLLLLALLSGCRSERAAFQFQSINTAAPSQQGVSTDPAVTIAAIAERQDCSGVGTIKPMTKSLFDREVGTTLRIRKPMAIIGQKPHPVAHIGLDKKLREASITLHSSEQILQPVQPAVSIRHQRVHPDSDRGLWDEVLSTPIILTVIFGLVLIGGIAFDSTAAVIIGAVGFILGLLFFALFAALLLYADKSPKLGG